jgi:Flp pilus assembly pilin Flp
MFILKKLLNEEKGQLSIEYLVLVVFGMMLVITTGLVVVNLNGLVSVAKAKILTYRDNILANLV